MGAVEVNALGICMADGLISAFINVFTCPSVANKPVGTFASVPALLILACCVDVTVVGVDGTLVDVETVLAILFISNVALTGV